MQIQLRHLRRWAMFNREIVHIMLQRWRHGLAQQDQVEIAVTAGALEFRPGGRFERTVSFAKQKLMARLQQGWIHRYNQDCGWQG